MEQQPTDLAEPHYSGDSPEKKFAERTTLDTIAELFPSGDRPDVISSSFIESLIRMDNPSQNSSGYRKDKISAIRLKTEHFLKGYHEQLNRGDFTYTNSAEREQVQRRIEVLKQNIDELYKAPTDPAQHISFFINNLIYFITDLYCLTADMEFFCNPVTCPQMRGYSQQLYLCAAHGSPKECSAIEYCNHTLDNLLDVLKNKLAGSKQPKPYLQTAIRRTHRIFHHLSAYHFVHFIKHERNMLLCTRFEQFCLQHDFLKRDQLLDALVHKDVDSVETYPADAFPEGSPDGRDPGHKIIAALRKEKEFLYLIGNHRLLELSLMQPPSRYNLSPGTGFKEEGTLP